MVRRMIEFAQHNLAQEGSHDRCSASNNRG